MLYIEVSGEGLRAGPKRTCPGDAARALPCTAPILRPRATVSGARVNVAEQAA